MTYFHSPYFFQSPCSAPGWSCNNFYNPGAIMDTGAAEINGRRPLPLQIEFFLLIHAVICHNTSLPELQPYRLAPGTTEQVSFIEIPFLILAVKGVDQFDKRLFPIADKLIVLRIFIRFIVSVTAYCAFHNDYLHLIVQTMDCRLESF